MIRYALHCQTCAHEFESWFARSEAFDTLKKSGDLACPTCDSNAIEKQIMAPSVRTKSAGPAKDAAQSTLKALNEAARAHIADQFDYVGDGFADEARAMYYGETDERPIWGETTAEESKALKEEGVPAQSLPEAWAPPKPVPDTSLN
jgi:hypothetical protein